MLRLLYPCVFVLAASACASNAALVHSNNKNVSLQLIPKDDPASYLAAYAPTSIAKSGEPANPQEEAVWKSCGYVRTSTSGKLAIVPILVGLGVEYFLNSVSDAVAREIASYNASFSANVSDTFADTSSVAKLTPRWSCVRLSRYVMNNDQRTLAFDLIIGLFPHDDYMQITPLRLYYAVPAMSRKDITKATVSVSLKATAFWRQRNHGDSAELFDSALIALTCDISSGPAIWYSKPSNNAVAQACEHHATGEPDSHASGAEGIISPLPSYSVSNDGAPVGGGYITLTAAAAEVATPPRLLCTLATALKSEKGTIQSALVAAVDQRLGIKQDTQSQKGTKTTTSGDQAQQQGTNAQKDDKGTDSSSVCGSSSGKLTSSASAKS